ncbi:MAG: restriction endonuclease subunit S [Eubacteriales bacterium]|nr:restriction endonuclease subunit S [Synergistaceae bacterium]MDD4445795.1 restriction endonuclease subunit S [Eubacteriales bacterium]
MSAGDVEGFAIDPTKVRAWKRYPAYKDSGVEWLGEVPAGWEVKWLKHISTVNDDTLSENTPPDYRVLYVDISNVDPIEGIQNIEEMTFEKSPSRARRIVQSGDVIVSTVRTYLRAIAPIVDPPENLIVSTGFAVIRPNSRFDSRFAGYTLRGSHFIESVVARSEGVSYPAINASELVSLKIPLPPLPEQHVIAAFLDRETARIDALIEKKHRFIELLKEKRQAIINHAVTKGLDQDAEMKDSGVEWIGEVPTHWDVINLKQSWDVIDCKHRTAEYVDDGIPIVSTTEVKPGRLSLENTRLTTESEYLDLIQGRCPKKGDIVLSRNASLGSAAYVDTDQKFCMGQDVCLVKSKDCSQLYLTYQINSPIVQNQIVSTMVGATIRRINVNQIKNLLVVKPPRVEQELIGQFLDCETAKIDTVTNTINQQIERLQEYRTALISAAVTGKIDVRGEGEAA